jgi:hypothetical protein
VMSIELVFAFGVGGSLVGSFVRGVLMNRHCDALYDNNLVGRLWVVSLVGGSLVGRLLG